MTLNRQNFKALALPCFRLVSRGLFVAATLISNRFASSSCSVELVSTGDAIIHFKRNSRGFV